MTEFIIYLSITTNIYIYFLSHQCGNLKKNMLLCFPKYNFNPFSSKSKILLENFS
jgi:hypothetical protein